MPILSLFPSFYECSHTNSSCSCSKKCFLSLFLKKGERKREEEKENKDTGVIVGPLLMVVKPARVNARVLAGA